VLARDGWDDQADQGFRLAGGVDQDAAGGDRRDTAISTMCGTERSRNFRISIPAYEEKIAELAENKVDLIHPAGTPPFMLFGY
jgi:hypothetical protein